MFVFDPSDPRIFLPKPSGLGQTLNFAHPASWAILGALVVVIGVAAYLKRRKQR